MGVAKELVCYVCGSASIYEDSDTMRCLECGIMLVDIGKFMAYTSGRGFNMGHGQAISLALPR